MMQILASAILALGFFANAALAGGYTDADLTTTETQEIGSTTSDGSIWYSMKICEIVQHTQCDTTLSQGGAAPPEETGTEGNYPPPPGDKPVPTEPATTNTDYSPPPASGETAPTEGGEQPPVSSQGSGGGESAPTEGGGSQPGPTAVTTTNSAGESTTIGGSFVPATTNEKATGTATGETTGQASSTGGAFVLTPAVMPAMLYGLVALFMIII